MKHIKIGSNRAEILTESRDAHLRVGDKGVLLPDVPARINKAWLDAAKAKAIEVGADSIEIYHHRYVRYSSRYEMRNRSGSYDTITVYRRNAAGNWVVTRKTQNGTY